MKRQVLFVHSAGSQGPEEGSSMLVEYLRTLLGENYEVLAPAMPDPENPRYDSWKRKLAEVFGQLDDNLLLVGHSLGGSVILRFLSEEKPVKSIAALFLVATPYWGKKDWEIEEFVLSRDFPDKLPEIGQICLYHSRGDEWVPYSHLLHFSEKLPQAVVRSVEGTEHEFFDGLPELVSDIKNVK